MIKSRQGLAWVCAGVLALAAVVWKLAPLPDAQGRLAVLAAGPGQRLESVALSEVEAGFFGEAKAARWLTRGGGAGVVVTVVDGNRNRRAVHDPAFCFRGAGWTVAAEEPLALPHGEARKVTLKRDGAEVEAVYWYSDGRRAHGSPPRYWASTTWRRLTLGASGPEPVLVLLVPAQGRDVAWGEWLARWPQFTRI